MSLALEMNEPALRQAIRSVSHGKPLQIVRRFWVHREENFSGFVPRVNLGLHIQTDGRGRFRVVAVSHWASFPAPLYTSKSDILRHASRDGDGYAQAAEAIEQWLAGFEDSVSSKGYAIDPEA